MSASHSNLSRIRTTFGSCLGLSDQDQVDKALEEKAKLKARIGTENIRLSACTFENVPEIALPFSTISCTTIDQIKRMTL